MEGRYAKCWEKDFWSLKILMSGLSVMVLSGICLRAAEKTTPAMTPACHEEKKGAALEEPGLAARR